MGGERDGERYPTKTSSSSYVVGKWSQKLLGYEAGFSTQGLYKEQDTGSQSALVSP